MEEQELHDFEERVDRIIEVVESDERWSESISSFERRRIWEIMGESLRSDDTVTIHMPKADAHLLLAAIQAVVRHPGWNQLSRRRIVMIGVGIQYVLSENNPEEMTILELGWRAQGK